MRPGLHFFPLAAPILGALLLAAVLLLAMIEVQVIGYAYEKVGIGHRQAFAFLLLSLLGSYINIPVGELPAEHVVSGQEITAFGMRWVIPMVENWPGTVIAVNVGGAVLPVLLSGYLLLRTGLWVRGAVAFAHGPRARLRRRQPRHARRRRPHEPGQAPGARRAGRVDRRGRHVRRHLPHGDSGGAPGVEGAVGRGPSRRSSSGSVTVSSRSSASTSRSRAARAPVRSRRAASWRSSSSRRTSSSMRAAVASL